MMINDSKRLENAIEYTKKAVLSSCFDENYARRVGFEESAHRYLHDVHTLCQILRAMGIETTFDTHTFYTTKVYFTDVLNPAHPQTSYEVEHTFDWLNSHV